MGEATAGNPPTRDPASQGLACRDPLSGPASREIVAQAAGFMGLVILVAIRETTREISTKLVRQGFRVTQNS